MKRIISIILAAFVLFGSVSFAEESTTRDTQDMWQTVYELMELVGENPTKDQFTQVSMYCIIAKYEDMQSKIESNKNFYSDELPQFGSFLPTDILDSYISVQNDSLEYEYRAFYSILLYCAKCYESNQYTWGGLKRYAYVSGYFNSDKYDREYVDSLSTLDLIEK